MGKGSQGEFANLTKDFSDFQWLGLSVVGLVVAMSAVLVAMGRNVHNVLLFGGLAGVILVFATAKKPEPVVEKKKKTKKEKKQEKSEHVKSFTGNAYEPEPEPEKAVGLSKQQKRRLKKKEAAIRAEEEAVAAKATAKAEAKKRKKKNRKAAKNGTAVAEKVEEEKAETGKKKKKKGKKKKAAPKPVVESSSEEDEIEDADGAGEFVVYKSKSKARLSAKRQAEKVSGKPPVSAKMTVAQKHYGAIFGKEGSNLEHLQKQTNTTIDVPSKEDRSQQITITGQPEGIELAKQALSDIISKGYATVLNPNMSSKKMDVPRRKMGVLIGPSGATVRTIQEKTSVRITLPPKNDEKPNARPNKDDESTASITIMGDRTNVALAEAAIRSLITDGYSELTHPGFSKTVMPFPSSLLYVLIGPKGETIQKLQKRTNTRVNVPKTTRAESGEELITIVGPQSDVARCASEVRQLQADFFKDECEIPEALKMFLLGPKGMTIRGIQSKTGCNIKITDHLWDPSIKTIVLEGLKPGVIEAKKEIAAIVAANTRLEVDFPVDKIGSLVGAKGTTMNRIQRDCKGVRITIQDHEWDTGVKDVVLTGPTDMVTKALGEIEKIKSQLKRDAQARKDKVIADKAARAEAEAAREAARAEALAAKAAAVEAAAAVKDTAEEKSTEAPPSIDAPVAVSN